MVAVQEVLYELKHGVDIEHWIVKGLTSLTPDLLESAILEWQDPLGLADYLHLENRFVKFFVRTLLKEHWERVEHTLVDPWELYNQIARDPEKKKLLDTPQGRKWLTYVRRRCYNYYYDYTWK